MKPNRWDESFVEVENRKCSGYETNAEIEPLEVSKEEEGEERRSRGSSDEERDH